MHEAQTIAGGNPDVFGMPRHKTNAVSYSTAPALPLARYVTQRTEQVMFAANPAKRAVRSIGLGR